MNIETEVKDKQIDRNTDKQIYITQTANRIPKNNHSVESYVTRWCLCLLIIRTKLF